MAKKKEHAAPPVEPVHLTRLGKFDPPVYLTIIWGALILVLFALIAILPGMIKSGRYYTFSSPVKGSAVYLDGEYLGSGTFTEFVPSGEHSLTYAFRDVASLDQDFKVRGKVLFTHLFPRKYPVRSPYYLNTETLKAYLNELFSDVISHSAILTYDDVYHYPPLFAYAAQTAAAGDDSTLIISFLKDSALFITSEEMRNDYFSALDFLQEQGLDISSLQEIRNKLAALSYEDGNQSGAPSSLPVQASQTTFSAELFTLDGYTIDSRSMMLGRENSTITYPGVQEGLKEVSLSTFTISEGEISEYLYALFVEENPSWSKERKEQLISSGLVDESYLEGIYLTTAYESVTPIRNISLYAAEAFTEWVTMKTGTRVTLPSEAQWELASSLNPSYGSTLNGYNTGASPVSLFGGVWEMTTDAYIPLERYLGYSPERDTEISSIVIKGGSYRNEAGSIDRATRGIMKRNECSDTAGFRIVWY